MFVGFGKMNYIIDESNIMPYILQVLPQVEYLTLDVDVATNTTRFFFGILCLKGVGLVYVSFIGPSF
jgi:hypothetical protein